MGYNTWYDETCADAMNASSVNKTAGLMISSGLATLGYKYVNLDGCFLTPGAGGRVNGTLMPDEDHFGGHAGIKALASELHANGFLFGVYTDRGSLTCQNREGSHDHETIDAQTYAEWGVDYVKEDSCHAYDDEKSALLEYGLMRDALNATGRPMFFAACGWHEWYAPPDPAMNYTGGNSLANSARIGGDDNDWSGVLANIDIMAQLSEYAGPGYWNDPCLLLSKDHLGVDRMTELQTRAQFSMWCILSAPLLISGSLPLMSTHTMATYSNAAAIAVNQVGVQGVRLTGGDIAQCAQQPVPGPNCTNVWGKRTGHKTWTVLLINFGNATANVTCDSDCLASLNIASGDLPLVAEDVWTNKSILLNTMTLTAKGMPPLGGHHMFNLYTHTEMAI